MFQVGWKVILTTGRKISKHTKTWDVLQGCERPVDWTLDLIATGDILKIKELHLIYPGLLPARLKIIEQGTAFQFVRQIKGVDMSTMQMIDRVEAQIVGKIINKEEGLCEGYIWDRVKGLLQYEGVSIYDFPSWREGLMPPGRLALDVLGVRL